MDPTKTVQVKLVLGIDKSAPAAFRGFAKELNKANQEVVKQIEKTATDAEKKWVKTRDWNYQAAGTAGLLGQSGLGSRIAQTTNAAAGLQRMGFGLGARALGSAALPLALAGGALNVAQSAADSVYDKYSTHEQNMRKAFRDLVPGGEKIQGFVDSMTGRKFKMEQANIDAQLGAARFANQNEQAAFRLGFNPQQAGLTGYAKAFAGQSAVAPSVFDRSGALGERLFREEQRLIPLRQQELKTARDLAQATGIRVGSEKELSSLTQTGNELASKRARLMNDLNKDENQSGPERKRVLNDIDNVNTALQANLGLQKQAQGQVLESRRGEIGARSEKEKSILRTKLEGQAGILDDRAQAASGAATKLAGMNPYERSFGIQALKLALNNPWDSLPPEVQQAAYSIAPATVGKLMEKHGAGTAEFAELRKLAPDEVMGTPEELRRKAADMRNELARSEFDIDSRSAQQIAAVGDKFGDRIGDIMNRLLQSAEIAILNKVKQGRTDQ